MSDAGGVAAKRYDVLGLRSDRSLVKSRGEKIEDLQWMRKRVGSVF